MIKEAIGTGSSLDEARKNAIAALNANDNDDIHFDIISTGKKKFLGMFGGEDAKVRVYVELPDASPNTAPKKKPAGRPNRPKPNLPKAERKPAEKLTDKTASTEKIETVKKEVKKEERAPKAVNSEKQTHVPASVEDDYKNAVDASELSPDLPASRAVAYLTDILTKLGCTDIKARVAEKENGAFIILDGEGLGVVIGHRGETLDSLQYLAGLAANNGGGYYKVSLNIGNYREKREQTLISLAKRVAEQVKSTGRNKVLEPMNPYERRIIHTAVQDIEGVISGSIGEGSSRRVVIAAEGSDIHAVRSERRGGHSGNRGRGGRGGRDKERKTSNTVATVPTREPKKDSDIPLYGKIN